MKRLGRLLVTITVLSMLIMSYGANREISRASTQADPITITLDGYQQVKYAATATADFNGDGYKEVVVGTVDGYLHIISYDGATWTRVLSWQTNDDINAASPPNPTTLGKIDTAVAIADLNHDGSLEIIVTVGGNPHVTENSERRNGGVLVYSYQSAWAFGLIAPPSAGCTTGWPQPCIDAMGSGSGFSNPDGYWDGIITAPAVGNIDADADLEIVVEGLDRRLHAWNYDGSAVTGWPIDSEDGIVRGGVASPALGNLDDDEALEIVFGTMNPGKSLLVFDGDSTLLFLKDTEQYIYSSPTLADIDGDDALEIVHGTGNGVLDKPMNKVYAWNHDGTPVHIPGGTVWPQQASDANDTTMSPAAIGNIDSDPEPEIVIGGAIRSGIYDNNLYAWNADGSLVPGFPMKPTSPNGSVDTSYPMPYTPILADFDGDGTVEILVTHIGSPGVTIVEPDGTTSDHTTYTLIGFLDAPPTLDDLDNDGLLEMVVAGKDILNNDNGVVKIWDLTGRVTDEHPWPMYRHDVMRTGRLDQEATPKLGFTTGAIRVFHDEGSSETTETSHGLRIWNEGDGTFDWTLTASTSDIVLSAISGSLSEGTTTSVPFTVSTDGLSSGWTTVGTITAEATFEGTAIEGSPQTVTVGVFVGDVQSIYLPIMLK